ncbi:MAG: alpha-1,2-fucosyltransferase [Minisyncoccia bacterium]
MRVKIQGGLGNQLFQYAYGKNLELAGKKVVFDTSFFHNKSSSDTARDFKLNNYNIETKSPFCDCRESALIRNFRRVLRHLKIIGNGYYQSEKYFKNIEAEIRKEFTLKNSLTKEALTWQEKIKGVENSVSIHIRRGDYVQDQKTKAFHGSCDIEYYKKGLEVVTNKIGKNIEIFVFSDDIDWAKTNLSFAYQTNFVSNPAIFDYEEIYLISLCKNNIIANSTFSWWGAWLNQNPNKIVVAPKQWLANKTSDKLGILPTDWTQI